MQQVEVRAAPLETLGELLLPERRDRFLSTAAHARVLLSGRIVWNVNATAHGGGVAEMLQTLLAYARGAEVDTRWLVLDADPAFFAITKRIHNALHGSLDGSGASHEAGGTDEAAGLGAAEHEHYQAVLSANLDFLRTVVGRGDIVLLHDPQTAGLVRGLSEIGAHVVWRSHIGRDDQNADTAMGWRFLRRYLEDAQAFVFSRARYAPDWLPAGRVRVIPPSIDPTALKNRDLTPAAAERVLRRVGLLAGGDGITDVEFTRRNGSVGVLRRHTDLLLGTSPPEAGAPLVVQVSRWDRLKDMAGVLSAFAEHTAAHSTDAHLVLAGPDTSGVSDDPEGAGVLASCLARWSRLPQAVRQRCHLAAVPMDDVDENALIVNALQRQADVVVQKSLVEGFGLTVTEAMWKSRPVLAAAVGGIQDQIVDGTDGLLLPDPHDLGGFAQRLQRLLDDAPLRTRIGQAAREHVRDEFLGDRHLTQWVALFDDLISH